MAFLKLGLHFFPIKECHFNFLGHISGGMKRLQIRKMCKYRDLIRGEKSGKGASTGV
jgi:hypothetical protein